MVDELRLVAVLDDCVRSVEGCVDIALVELPAREQVALLVDRRRTVFERGLWVSDDRQLLVVDVDQFDGGERRVHRLGGDDRDRLTVIADDAVGEHIRPGLQCSHLESLARNVDPDGVLRNVLRGQDRHDAGHSLRGGRIHAEQARVGEIRPLERRLEHSGHADACGPVTDGRHGTSPSRSRYASTASTILP